MLGETSAGVVGVVEGVNALVDGADGDAIETVTGGRTEDVAVEELGEDFRRSVDGVIAVGAAAVDVIVEDDGFRRSDDMAKAVAGICPSVATVGAGNIAATSAGCCMQACFMNLICNLC